MFTLLLNQILGSFFPLLVNLILSLLFGQPTE